VVCVAGSSRLEYPPNPAARNHWSDALSAVSSSRGRETLLQCLERERFHREEVFVDGLAKIRFTVLRNIARRE
jgi:hypothetical protein